MVAQPAPSAATGVKIRRVEAIPVRLPFKTTFTIASPSERTRDHVDILLVRILSDAGAVGIGETQAWRRQGTFHTLATLASTVRDVLAPRLIGRSPFDVADTMHGLAASCGNLYALAAVADALYDLAARLLGVPVCALVGAATPSTVAVGAEIGIPASEAEAVDLAVEHVRRGFRHLRVKIGLDVEQDLARIRAIRARLGATINLRADANGGLRFEDAAGLLSRLEELELEFLEQAMAAEDLDGMAALARATRIPIAADESLTTERSLVEIADHEAARIVQPRSRRTAVCIPRDACGRSRTPTASASCPETIRPRAWPWQRLRTSAQHGRHCVWSETSRPGSITSWKISCRCRWP